MDGASNIFYGLRAYFVRANKDGGRELHASHIGYYGDSEEAERTIVTQAGGLQSPLDTATRTLLCIKLSAYEVGGGTKAVDARVYDRWGDALEE